MQKVFCVNQPKKHNASIDPPKNHPPKSASNAMHKTEMRQKSPPKNASKITPQINASKITPQKVRQNSSASKFSASKIIKNINASKFCASEITPSVSASYATLRQNSMSQNSRVIVPCVKRSVRHRPFSHPKSS